MNLKKLTIAPMLALALFAVGCGADCESVCEDGNECEGAESEDCGKFCEEIEKAGCEDQGDELASCIDDQDDVCKVDLSKTCTNEFEALTKCMAE